MSSLMFILPVALEELTQTDRHTEQRCSLYLDYPQGPQSPHQKRRGK